MKRQAVVSGRAAGVVLVLVAACGVDDRPLQVTADAGAGDASVGGTGGASGGSGGAGGEAGSAGTGLAGTGAGGTGAAGTGAGGMGGSGGVSGAGGIAGTGGIAGSAGGGAGGSAGTSGSAGAAAAGGTAGASGTGGGGMVYGVPGQSCDGLGPICHGEDCCSTLFVEGATYPMGRSLDGTDQCAYSCGADELPEHDVTVSDFYLDKYEVTLARFRKFLEVYDGTLPEEGAGRHPSIDGSGWQTSFNGSVAPSADVFRTVLLCDTDMQTVNVWTDVPAGNEDRPINCVRWYEAFAFCIWDGGRLPTEAEWELAAAAGGENRLYPWGDGDPASRTNCNTFALPSSVGSYPNGASALGHMDMGGNVSEFVLDYYASDWYDGPCVDCANLEPGSYGTRVYRGGSVMTGESDVRSAARQYGAPNVRRESTGFSCARDGAL